MRYNIDIHWDFARSLAVEADSEEEAHAIVDDAIQAGRLTVKDLFLSGPHPEGWATEDYETDSSWQPEYPDDCDGYPVNF